MKLLYTFAFGFALCLLAPVVLSAQAQPTEFTFTTSCVSTVQEDVVFLFAQVTLDGVPLPDQTWVVAVDEAGNQVGITQSYNPLPGTYDGIIEMPIYLNDDTKPGCSGDETGINCSGIFCERFGIIVGTDDGSGGFCYFASIPFIPYALNAAETEIDGYESDGVINMTATIIDIDTQGGTICPSYADAFTSLPVEYAAFTGQYRGKQVDLYWETASESGNDFFTVQRSTDGLNFSDIGRVAGAGNSNVLVEYGFQDRSPVAGTNYYRLRQDDFDGAFSFSGVIAVEVGGQNAAQVRVWPNPAKDFLSITLDESWSTQVDARLIDQSGRTVSNWSQAPGVSHSVDVGDVPVGVYQLVLTAGKQTKTERIVLR